MSKFRRFEGFRPKDPQSFPIPKGNSLYARAKKAEYIDKNAALAKSLYQQSIDQGERTESAVKDMASILHQEGRTQEAIDLLLQYKSIFTEQQKFQNLLENLQDKLVPTGNCLNKHLRIFPVPKSESVANIKRLFRDPSRILHVQIVPEKYALLQFSSHSAARKTLNTFCKWSGRRVEWANELGEGIKAKKEVTTDMETAIFLLGRELMSELCFEKSLNVAANPFVPPGRVTVNI